MGGVLPFAMLLVGLRSSLGGRVLSAEEVLLTELSDSYHVSARPVTDSSMTVFVTVQFSLMHIKELDVRSQVLTTTGLLIMEWSDERLAWNPQDYSNLTELVVDSSSIWTPEFAVINGAEKIYENYSNFRAIVTSTGHVRWEPGGVFRTMCQIDITYYPFDQQACDLMFGAWSYHTSKMNFTSVHNVINLDSNKKNGEWEIISTGAKRDEFAYTCCPDDKFSYVAFQISMRRRHTFYVMNIILPSIMTSVLLLSVFFCTPGQKVQIGVVVLLSFRIFLLNVTDSIPKTSDHIPILAIYLTCTMAITTLSMVLTVFILNLHHITDRPVPHWLRRLVLLYMGRILGICNKDIISNSSNNNKGKDVLYTTVSSENLNEKSSLDSQEMSLNVELGHKEGDVGAACLCKGKMLEKGRRFDRREEYGRDWRQIAEVFDRLFFWLFLLAILISTLVLFHPLTRTETSSDNT